MPTTNAPNPGGTAYPSSSLRPSSGPSAASPARDPDSVEGPSGQGGGDTERSEPIPAGGVAGIVLASAFAVFAAGYLYATRKRRREEDDDQDLADVRNKDLDEDLEAGLAAQESKGDDDDDDPTRAKTGATGGGGDDRSYDEDYIGEVAGSIGSDSDAPHPQAHDDTGSGSGGSHDGATGSYIPQTSEAVARSPPPSSDIPLISGVPPSPKRSKLDLKEGGGSSNDDSSSAGESGWSSSAGMSSLNTASFDAGTDDGLLLGSPDRLLATLGAASTAAEVAGSVQRDAK